MARLYEEVRQNPRQADFSDKCRHLYGLQRFVVVYHNMRSGNDSGNKRNSVISDFFINRRQFHGQKGVIPCYDIYVEQNEVRHTTTE